MKILYLVSRVPYPKDKGDKLRAFLHAERLSKDHELHLCCLQEEALHPDVEERLGKISHRLSILPLSKPLILWNLFLGLFSSRPFQVNYFYQAHLKRRLKKLIEEDPPDLIYCQLIRTSEYVKELHRFPKVIDYMDAFSKGAERHRDRSRFPLKPLLKEESRRTARYENLVFDYFDRHLIISAYDRDRLPHPSRERIQVVPNWIDTEHFCPQDREKDRDLLFTGNMAYPPNVESAHYLVKKILPIVRAEIPEVRVYISGVSPTRKVRALEGKGVEVSGWVPDLRDSYARSKLFIAPMVMGRGMQNKLLEAMAMGIACITTPLAYRAIGATPEKEILVGRDEEELAQHVIRLLKEPGTRERIAENGRDLIREQFGAERNGKLLERTITGEMEAKTPDGRDLAAGFP